MRDVDLAQACRLINHGPTVLVSSVHGARRNLMAAAWSMPVEFAPPRVAVVIDKSTYTRELVLASGCFALSLPGRALADLTFRVGSTSGRELCATGSDKFAHFGIATHAGLDVAAEARDALLALQRRAGGGSVGGVAVRPQTWRFIPCAMPQRLAQPPLLLTFGITWK